MRIVVTGGGTGGHIMPAIAIAEALQARRSDVEILYIGGATGMETRLVPEYGIPFQAVTSRKLRKVASIGTVGVMVALLKGYREARTFIRAFHADAVVGTGGYAAAATVLAGEHLGIPALIHEGNYLVGRTNRYLANQARTICVTFTETVSAFPAGKAVQTGLPLRHGIIAPADLTREAARCRFDGLVPDRFTVFVTGGSQGARALNNLVLDALPALLDTEIQVLHLTGPANLEGVQAKIGERGIAGRGGYCPRAFLDHEEMPTAMRAADILLCRGGVSTLSEAMVNGRPAIVVPLPTAYADHQTYNARAMEAAGAALHRPQSALTAMSLARDIMKLRDDRTRLARMQQASLAAGRPNAADAVADEVLKLEGLGKLGR